MSDQAPSLYGSQPEAQRPKAPGLLEQILGVFTEPAALFQRLNKAPSWGWALGVVTAGAVVLTVIWGLKVDVDEMLRPMLERNPNVAAGQIDMIIGMQKRFILPFGILGSLFIPATAMALVALLYWLVGKRQSESEGPDYPQALSAAVVPGLVKLPQLLLLIVLCLVKPIGGLTPDKIAPTSLGYFIQAENLKLHALLYSLDLFHLAEAGLTYLALRHLLRMKTGGAVLCTLLPLLLGIGFRVLGAK